jgi:hypothetical protein
VFKVDLTTTNVVEYYGAVVDGTFVESVTRGPSDDVYNGWCLREGEGIYAASVSSVDDARVNVREIILFILTASLFFYLINITLPYWKADTLPANLRRIWPLGTDDSVDGYKDEDEDEDDFDNEAEYEDGVVMPELAADRGRSPPPAPRALRRRGQPTGRGFRGFT